MEKNDIINTNEQNNIALREMKPIICTHSISMDRWQIYVSKHLNAKLHNNVFIIIIYSKVITT